MNLTFRLNRFSFPNRLLQKQTSEIYTLHFSVFFILSNSQMNRTKCAVSGKSINDATLIIFEHVSRLTSSGDRHLRISRFSIVKIYGSGCRTASKCSFPESTLKNFTPLSRCDDRFVKQQLLRKKLLTKKKI